MGYIESLMATGEQIVYRTKKHWIAPLLASLTGTLLTVLGLVAMTGNLFVSASWLGTIMLWGGLGALVVGIALLLRSFVIWWSQDYIVTNQKVMKVEGILRKRAGGAGLEKINDVTLEQDLLGRWLDYGSLRVLTAADEGNLHYRVMRRPAEFRRAMLDQKINLEQADARYIAQAVREAPVAAAAAAATDGRDDDIPALIAQLAQLHAQGAITTAEFEAKKAELLRRM